MEQEIRFCTTSDGVRVAHATVGEGPPLVVVSAWLSHIEAEWGSNDVRAFWEALANGRRVIRYDKRGVGLSERDVDDLSLETRGLDLEAVIDALGIERCDLFAMSEGGATAVQYTLQHPEKVERLVLYGSYARIGVGMPKEVKDAMLALIRAQWGMGSAALAALFMPNASPDDVASFNKLQQVAAHGETVATIIEESAKIDVRAQLKDVHVPTLVLHRKGDALHPVRLAQEMAALIPDARFKLMEGDTYPPWWGDSQAILRAIDGFLGGADIGGAAAVELPDMSQVSLLTILFTDIESSTAITQRLGDAAAQKLLRTHNTVVREQLDAHAGIEVKHTGDGIMAVFRAASPS